MSHINYIGGMKRSLDYVRIANEQHGDYEPAMFIKRERIKGVSFCIPIGAMYKYIDPGRYKKDERLNKVEWQEFNQKAFNARNLLEGRISDLYVPISEVDRQRAIADLVCCEVAYKIHKHTSISICTAWNLAKMMQMFEITPCPPAAAQLLLWIQGRLEDLKDMPPHEERDEQHVIGRATLKLDGETVISEDVSISNTQAVIDEGEVYGTCNN